MTVNSEYDYDSVIQISDVFHFVLVLPFSRRCSHHSPVPKGLFDKMIFKLKYCRFKTSLKALYDPDRLCQGILQYREIPLYGLSANFFVPTEKRFHCLLYD